MEYLVRFEKSLIAEKSIKIYIYIYIYIYLKKSIFFLYCINKINRF